MKKNINKILDMRAGRGILRYCCNDDDGPHHGPVASAVTVRNAKYEVPIALLVICRREKNSKKVVDNLRNCEIIVFLSDDTGWKDNHTLKFKEQSVIDSFG